MKIAFTVGARPNFVKAAPVIRAFRKMTNHNLVLIHTGQHYDTNMSDVFLEQLGMPKADFNLTVGSGSHAEQTANIMLRIEKVLLRERPNWLFVFGDVNSTIACALVGKKLGIKIAHVEAGLRSYDDTMPEEINRKLTDTISDLFFVTEQSGVNNLYKEGVPKKKIHLVGNTMIDSIVYLTDQINASTILKKLNLKTFSYSVVTLHRPSNVDDVDKLNFLVQKIQEWNIAEKIIWPVHPRVKNRFINFDSTVWQLVQPLSYLDFLHLLKYSKAVYTDSGGIQEETSYLGIPCFTLRKNTERPITVSVGNNILVTEKMMKNGWKPNKINHIKTKIPFWDGISAERIIKVFSGL